MSYTNDDLPIVNYILILTNIAVFFIVANFLGSGFVNVFAVSYSNIVNGNYMSLIISGFLHADISHLFWNMLFMLMLGGIVEKEFGKGLYIVTFFLSIILGNLLYIILFPGGSAIGASGAVFGLMAAAMLTHPLRPIFRIIPIPVSLIGIIYIIGELTNVFNLSGGIAHIAHIGGAIAGCLVAMATRKEEVWKGIIIIIIITIILFYFGLIQI